MAIDENVFIPSKKKQTDIRDLSIIYEAVNCYFSKEYREMTGFIMEYGETQFFADLFKYFEFGWWRNSRNKYLTFVGITTEYFNTWAE